MKQKMINCVMSLFLALVCVMGILPLSAFAADGLSTAPGSITQKDCDYFYNGGHPVRYKSASDIINAEGLPFVFDEQVDVPGYGTTRALCAYHNGSLGSAANGQKWNFKNEVNTMRSQTVDRHGRCYAALSVDDIAGMIDRTPATVRKALNELEGAGLVERMPTSYKAPDHIYAKLPSGEGTK